MSADHTNQFGRKGGRGLRPWLLIPKILAVAVYFGSLVAAGVISFAADPRTTSQWNELGLTLGVIFRFAALPGLLTAIVLGVLLVLQHPFVLFRMRWLQAKLVLLLISLPLLHAFMSQMVDHLRHVDLDRDSFAPQHALRLFHIGLLAALICAILLIWLGRHKPRLGQKIATVHQQWIKSLQESPL